MRTEKYDYYQDKNKLPLPIFGEKLQPLKMNIVIMLISLLERGEGHNGEA